MKKFIIIAVALVAVAAGVYFYKNKSSDSGSSVSSSVAKVFGGSNKSVVLEYVPADTVLFGGSLEPMNYEKAMELTRNMGFDFSSFLALADTEELNPDADASAGEKLAIGFYKAYLKGISGDLPKELGVSNTLDAAFYTVGALPVLRMSLDGSSTFSNLISSIEAEHKITPTVGNIDGVEFREYSFEEIKVNGKSQQAPVSLVIAIHDNQAVLTLNTILEDSKDLKLALGVEKPANSIASSKTLNNLMGKYGYQGYNIFFMDNLGAVKGLTDPAANSFGTMLKDLMVAYGNPDALQDFQTPACRTEYTALAANWPTISAGYTEISAKSASYKMMVEGTNADLLNTLQKLSGHLSPSLDNSDFLFSMGLGFNMDELTPVVTDIWKRMTKEPFHCAPLAEMQAEMKQNNPVMQLGMMGGFFAGIKGMGFAVVDLDMAGLENAQDNPMAAANSISMFITLSAEDPMSLVQMAGSFMPELASLDLKDGGEPQVLPLPLPVEVKGSLRGHDLVLSFGNKANDLANGLKSNTNIDLNGLMSFNMDMGKYFGMLDTIATLEGSNKEMDKLSDDQKKIFEMFKNIKGKVKEKVNFTDQGLSFEVDMVVD